MSKDCRNDCVERLRFPRSLDNRPGLSHIRYRIGTYADIREALLRNLDKSPNLLQWTHRGADDPGIALLEGSAILGDILTFYQELYANEAYLRTAQWRESIADLVRLLGYRLSPGLGGNTTFAFTIKGDQPVTIPAGFPVKAEVAGLPKPADFETSEQATAYPWLSTFNLFRPLDTPNITPATTEFSISTPDPFVTPIDLKPKDRLLIASSSFLIPARFDHIDIVIIDSIRELHGKKIYKVKGALKRTGSAATMLAYKIGRTFHHFGYNGPRKITKAPITFSASATTTPGTGGASTTTTTSTPITEYNHSFVRSLVSDTYTNESPFTNSEGVTNCIKYCDPSLSMLEFPLEGELNDLPAKTRLLVQTTLYHDASAGLEVTLERKIDSVRPVSQTYGLVTGPATVVTFDEDMELGIGGHDYNFTDSRAMLFHEVLSPTMTIVAAVEESAPATGQTLYFLGTESQAQALSDRRLFFVKPDADPEDANVLDVQTLSANLAARPLLHAVTLDRAMTYAEFPNEKPTVAVYGNLVDATQGKSEPSTPLGNGDNRLVFQTFKVPKAPLTYLISTSDTPPEVPELQIHVNGRLWERVASFFGRQGDEEIYIVREDAENISWVQFGDGQTGARLPSGVKNVTATYRTGTGAFGALKPGTKVQGGAKLDRLDKIQMPEVAAGGSQPEGGDNARNAAPGKIQSLDRLVSLADFESETLAISGVTKAAAAWQLVDNIPEVVVTVIMETGRSDEVGDVQTTIAGYNQGRGPNRFPVTVLGGGLKYVVVEATVGYDATYQEEDVTAAIQKALGINSGTPNADDDQSGLFSLRQRGFGKREYATTIAGTIQQVAGVVWAEVMRFESLGVLADPTIVTPPATPTLADIVSCESENVLSLYAGDLQLTGVAVTLPEVKK